MNLGLWTFHVVELRPSQFHLERRDPERFELVETRANHYLVLRAEILDLELVTRLFPVPSNRYPRTSRLHSSAQHMVRKELGRKIPGATFDEQRLLHGDRRWLR